MISPWCSSLLLRLPTQLSVGIRLDYHSGDPGSMFDKIEKFNHHFKGSKKYIFRLSGLEHTTCLEA